MDALRCIDNGLFGKKIAKLFDEIPICKYIPPFRN